MTPHLSRARATGLNLESTGSATGGPTFPRPVTVIAPNQWSPWSRVVDVWHFRDMFFFLVWRDVKARYAQSVLGMGWAVIQPLFPMIVFTIVFGKVARITSDGLPYAIFSYCALVPWTYFSNSLNDAVMSLVKQANLLSKIYFPRMIIPLTPVLGRLIDFGIAFIFLALLMVWFRITPTWWALTLPLLVLIMVMTAGGIGMALCALAVHYRDVKHAMGLAVQLLMYAAPVVYPVSLVPEPFRLPYALNPMVGVIEGFRSALLGANPMPWDLIAVSGVSAGAILVGGLFYFAARESVFADVV